jgi:predicted MFS family arabinose efflux permease
MPGDAVTLPQRPPPGAHQRHSTRAASFILGIALATWAPLVPFAQARLAVNDAQLGLLLLCLGAGSVVTMPLSGALVARFGCRRPVWAAGLCISAALPLLATLDSAPALALALLLFGASLGVTDVAVNTQAIIVEKAAGRALMSGFHGLFSVGGILGASGVSGLLWAGASPLVAALAADLVILGLLAIFGRHLLPYGSEDERRSALFALPHGVVLIIGLLCFITFLTEGAILDWGAIFLTSVRQVDPSRSGLGYAVFAFAMTLGRFGGDRIKQAIGGRAILIFGGLLGAASFALTVFVPSWQASLAGFWMVGLGTANIVPVLYSALGRQKIMPPNLAVAAVTTVGYLGILAGPALIGLTAHATSLSNTFLCVAAMLLLVAASSRLATP